MKIIPLALLLTFIALPVKVSAHDSDVGFRTGIDTTNIAVPWTDLNFYANPAHFQFAIVSDRTGGKRSGVFAQAIDRLNLLKPEFVICVGDLIQGYTEDEIDLSNLLRQERANRQNRLWEKQDQ